MKKIVLVFILKTSTDRCLNAKANLIVQYTWKYSIISQTNSPFRTPSTAWKVYNTEFSLVRIFPHSEWLRRNTDYLSPNARKYGREKNPYLDTFYAVFLLVFDLQGLQLSTIKEIFKASFGQWNQTHGLKILSERFCWIFDFSRSFYCYICDLSRQHNVILRFRYFNRFCLYMDHTGKLV